MKVNLKQKTAVVTGGAKGIGRAISETLSRNGARVCLLDTDAQSLAQTVAGIKAAGGVATGYPCDISDHDAVRDLLAQEPEFARIDILVNNAGVSHIGTVEQTREADFDRIYRINVKGLYNMVQAAYPALKECRGLILNMASVAGQLGIEDRFAYSMSKGAVLAMTYALAKDGLKHGIRCNSISPGRVHTPFVDGYLKAHYPGRENEMFEKLSATQPIGRMGKPEEIAGLILYLCSEEATFITGTDFPIDGGFIKLNG